MCIAYIHTYYDTLKLKSDSTIATCTRQSINQTLLIHPKCCWEKLITYAKNDYKIDVAQLKTIYIYIYLPKEKKRTIKSIKTLNKIDGSLQKKG